MKVRAQRNLVPSHALLCCSTQLSPFREEQCRLEGRATIETTPNYD